MALNANGEIFIDEILIQLSDKTFSARERGVLFWIQHNLQNLLSDDENLVRMAIFKVSSTEKSSISSRNVHMCTTKKF